MFAEDDDQRLLDRAQHSWDRLFRALARILCCGPPPPFRDCLRINTKPGGKSPVRFLALLNFASKLGVGAGSGVKLAGHDPILALPAKPCVDESQSDWVML